NKWWQIEVWDLGGGRARMRTTWGRVGAAPQCQDKTVSMSEVQRKIQEKRSKGYQELDLHVPQAAAAAPAVTTTAPAAVLPPKVERLLDLIFSEAGNHIASYLAVSVDALSQAQIRRGRDLLDQAVKRYLVWQRSRSRAVFGALV